MDIKLYTITDLYLLQVKTNEKLDDKTLTNDVNSKLQHNLNILNKIESFVTANANQFNLNGNYGYNPRIDEYFDLSKLLYLEVYE